MCFSTFLPQSSDLEVRKLSEQVLQKDEAVQKLQKEREHLVEFSQVRAQGTFLYYTARAVATRLTHRDRRPVNVQRAARGQLR